MVGFLSIVLYLGYSMSPFTTIFLLVPSVALRVCVVLEPGFDSLRDRNAAISSITSDSQLDGFNSDVRQGMACKHEPHMRMPCLVCHAVSSPY